MDSLKRREEAFEKRFAMQEELRFRAQARRNRAIGLWAGSLIGLDAGKAEALADVLVEEQVELPDDNAMAKALAAEFARANIDMSQRRIRRRMAATLARAEAELADPA